MVDFRALCAELVEVLDELNCHFNIPSQSAIVERVHAALAEPEPAPAADGKVADPAVRPIPVSERLPGPKDCDAESYCWRWNTIGRLWTRQQYARKWYEFHSHWLPAHALPLPEVE